VNKYIKQLRKIQEALEIKARNNGKGERGSEKRWKE
jgi:hypothetical protein